MQGEVRLVAVLCAGLLAASARADGGRIRLSQTCAPYQITVFTQPTPFRAGPVDVSVFVQDAASGKLVEDVEVRVRASNGSHQIEQMATTAAATNKLYRAALFDLPASGKWEVEVEVRSVRAETVSVGFEIDAAEALPRWQSMWLWMAWPIIPIVLFLFREWIQNQPAGTSTPKSRMVNTDW